MMRGVRLLVTLAAVSVALAALMSTVRAVAPASPPSEAARARLEQSTSYTRVQTVTLLSLKPATATNQTAFVENLWLDVNFVFGVPLPSDFMSATVSGGAYSITTTEPITVFGEVFTRSVSLSPTQGVPLYLGYYTDSRAAREGNQFRIFIRASSPVTSNFLATVVFTTPYAFVSHFEDPLSDTVPLGQPNLGPASAWWGPVEVHPGDVFSKYIAVGDSRLPVDLAIKSFGVIMSPDKTSVQVTATLINTGSIATGNFFLYELYDRAHPSVPPAGPNDHFGGACLSAPSCEIYRWGTNAYIYYPNLQPNETLLVTFTYPFHTAGQRDLYFQVDSFGGPSGFNLEPGFGETNNIVFLKTVDAVGYVYLPMVRKNK